MPTRYRQQRLTDEGVGLDGPNLSVLVAHESICEVSLLSGGAAADPLDEIVFCQGPVSSLASLRTETRSRSSPTRSSWRTRPSPDSSPSAMSDRSRTARTHEPRLPWEAPGVRDYWSEGKSLRRGVSSPSTPREGRPRAPPAGRGNRPTSAHSSESGGGDLNSRPLRPEPCAPELSTCGLTCIFAGQALFSSRSS